MVHYISRILIGSFVLCSLWPANTATGQQMLVPMGLKQNNHLKAYGLAYMALTAGDDVEWLLNYRGGSFVMPASERSIRAARLRGVSFTAVSPAELRRIHDHMEANNMERMLLEKAPRIAVYRPPDDRPWDDAVSLALDYADVPYDQIWDKEVLSGWLEKYDWVHLHHEDFTGQYSKFYLFRKTEWYRQQQESVESMSKSLGFQSVAEEKKELARTIRSYVARGGFLFAMCSSTETLEIALSAEGIDIVPPEYDGTRITWESDAGLDYDKTFAFKDFSIEKDPRNGAYSDIDMNQVNANKTPTHAFTLFEFSAKHDPVPTMLTQNHANYIAGFYGLLTTFNKRLLKGTVVVLGEEAGTDRVKYIYDNFGKGSFVFYGGHDPEDEEHNVNDPPTNLNLHKNSPGYRLILNNVLFPAAKHNRKLKT